MVPLTAPSLPSYMSQGSQPLATQSQASLKVIRIAGDTFCVYLRPNELPPTNIIEFIEKRLVEVEGTASPYMVGLTYFLINRSEYDQIIRKMIPLRNIVKKFSGSLLATIEKVEKLFPVERTRKQILVRLDKKYQHFKFFSPMSKEQCKLVLTGVNLEEFQFVNATYNQETKYNYVIKTINSLLYILLGGTPKSMQRLQSEIKQSVKIARNYKYTLLPFQDKQYLFERVLRNIFINDLYSLSLLDLVTVERLQSIYKNLSWGEFDLLKFLRTNNVSSSNKRKVTDTDATNGPLCKKRKIEAGPAPAATPFSSNPTFTSEKNMEFSHYDNEEELASTVTQI
ncbi:MAG: hypothetical protein PVI40_06305, partial [Chlamydiota bacterium]